MRKVKESDAVKALHLKIRRRRFLQLLGGSVGAVLVARCGPKPTPAPTTPLEATATPVPPTPTTPPEVTPTPIPPTPTPAPTPAPGTGVLIYAGGQDIPTLDPRDRGDYSINCMMRALYDSLWWQEGWPPKLSPNLCTHYEVSDDVREWVFHLDERAVFHDGTPVTAEAVEWTLKGILSFQRPRAANLLPVMNEDSIEVVDNHTLRIVLTTPFADLPWLLGYQGQVFIANPEEVMKHEVSGDQGEQWLLENAAGSGPFRIKRWEPGTVYEIEAVPDYWRGWPEKGRLDGVIWRIIRDSAERRMALLAGEVDIVDTLPVDDLPLVDDNPGTHTEVHPGFLTGYAKMNNQREPFNDPNFRKFMAYAFDYEGLVATQGGPELCPLLTGCLPDGVPGHDPNVQPIYRQDLEKAKEYLDKTPWADGDLEFDFVYVTGLPFEEAIGTMLAEPLAEFGITVNLVPKVWPDMVAISKDPEGGADTICTFDDNGPIATQWFRYQYYSGFWDKPEGGSWQSACFYKDPEFDALLEQAEQTADEEERMELVKQMQRMIMEDIPAVMLYTMPNMLGFSDRVKGYEYTGYIAVDFWPLWLEEA
jgi:peptide/nickel transport system substrate-binding protein